MQIRRSAIVVSSQPRASDVKLLSVVGRCRPAASNESASACQVGRLTDCRLVVVVYWWCGRAADLEVPST
jgi:hypothetical protein